MTQCRSRCSECQAFKARPGGLCDAMTKLVQRMSGVQGVPRRVCDAMTKPVQRMSSVQGAPRRDNEHIAQGSALGGMRR